VVVTVTDTCPCQYANNAYSNKRWCCGDMVSVPLTTVELLQGPRLAFTLKTWYRAPPRTGSQPPTRTGLARHKHCYQAGCSGSVHVAQTLLQCGWRHASTGIGVVLTVCPIRCCLMQNHFDLSVWAFQKLTDMKWGVIPVQ